jgi:putative Ca2+/H+ antiporter (TMEM165/GDT1 family)
MTSFQLVFYVFGVIFLAELPDKTALAALVLATRYEAAAVFIGAALALAVQSVIAVAAGSLLSFLPPRAIHIGAGLLFLGSAVVMWRRGDEDEHSGEKTDEGRPSFFKAVGTVFVVVFIAEWGDLTQFGTAALAARYRAPLAVFVGSTLGLWTALAIAVFVGNRAAKLLDPNRTKKIAAVVFALIGALLLAGVI